MLKRNVLFIDDNIDERIYPQRYIRIANELKKRNEKYSEYDLEFLSVNSIEKAKKLLEEGNQIVDILIIDYQFDNSTINENGSDLVDFIRKKINKRCKIVFYTMNNINSISREELINLIDNDVYRIIDKSQIEDDELVDIIFKASMDGDMLVSALERFWNEYGDALDETTYEVLGETISFKEIIRHIRLDDEIGRVFADKFMHKALLEAVQI